MRKDYQVRVTEVPGYPPLFEIANQELFIEDLYEMAGKNDYVVTFQFFPGSDAQNNFGDRLTGTIYYPLGQREEINQHLLENRPFQKQVVQFIPVLPSENPSRDSDLKYSGFQIQDAGYICFIPHNTRSRHGSQGIKEVPNMVPIELPPNDELNYGALFQYLCTMKMNAKQDLIDEEKAEFIGIELAKRNKVIDKRLLSAFGFKEGEIPNNQRIWYHYHSMIERNRPLTDEEALAFQNIKADIFVSNLKHFIKELELGQDPQNRISPTKEQLEKIFDSLKHFRPNVIMPGKPTIYWDEESYLHIVMRHVRDLQIGKNNIEKTPFPYEFKELKLLIEKILDGIEAEIKDHFQGDKKTKSFYRAGSMSVYYNGDYYVVRILPNGRLETVYKCD